MLIRLWDKFIFRQVVIASVALVQCINVGVALGFTSPLFSQLQKSDSFQLTTNEMSWLASIPILVMVPISATSCWALKLCGRKKCVLVCDGINLVSWLLLLFADDYVLLLTARIIHGVFLGLAYPTLISFVGEISAPKYRSSFLSLISLGSMTGVFIVQLVGEYLAWRTITLIFATTTIYNVLAMVLSASESYVTHLESGHLEKAKQCFQFYRGDTLEGRNEFDAILNAIPAKTSIWLVLKQCTTKPFLVPFAITVLVFLANEVTATQAVSFYSAQIVAEITPQPTIQFYAVLLLNLLRIVAVIISTRLVKMCSIRKVLLISGFLLAASLLAMALFMYLAARDNKNVVFAIISVLLLIANAILFGIGLGPLPSMVCGEMFPPITRANGCAWSAAFSFLFLFFVVKFMPIAIAIVGIHWTFCFFGVCTLIAMIACYFVVPETKNKTLQEINDLYLREDKI